MVKRKGFYNDDSGLTSLVHPPPFLLLRATYLPGLPRWRHRHDVNMDPQRTSPTASTGAKDPHTVDTPFSFPIVSARNRTRRTHRSGDCKRHKRVSIRRATPRTCTPATSRPNAFTRPPTHLAYPLPLLSLSALSSPSPLSLLPFPSPLNTSSASSARALRSGRWRVTAASETFLVIVDG